MKYKLINNQVRRNAIDAVATAPDGHIVEIKKPKRSLNQNAKLWAMLTDISRQVKWVVNNEKRYLVTEQWKDILTNGYAVETRLNASYAQGINGGVVMLGFRTSELDKNQMAELITYILAFGNDMGVFWSNEYER